MMIPTYSLATAAEGTEGSSLLDAELTAVILLTTAAGVAILARRIRVPFTVSLVVVGLVFAFTPSFVDLQVSPEFILGLLVPPLIFEATLNLPWPKLKADLGIVLAMAIGGTMLGTFIVAGIVRPVVDIPWLAAIAFGALISATDPVAVVAFFKTLGVEKRLNVLVEGESLFNDAVAIVVFTLAVNAATDGTSLSFGPAFGEFLLVGLGGLAVGIVLGYIVSAIVLANVDDHLIETSVTLALAYGSYLVAESFGTLFNVGDFHFSGILAVVAAGLMVGHVGLKNTSPTTRLTLENFWEFLTFLVNSFVFLLLGIEIDLTEIGVELGAVAVAIAAILFSRLLIVHVFAAVHAKIKPERAIPVSWRHVSWWGGLRGAISLALALSLGSAFDSDVIDTIQIMTFGVVLFTLLGQGTTIAALIRRLGLSGKDATVVEQQRRQAVLHSKQAGKAELRRLERDGLVFPDMADALVANYDAEIDRSSNGLARHVRRHPELEMSILVQTRRSALAAEKRSLVDLARRGIIDIEVSEHLAVDLNRRSVALDLLEARWESDPLVDVGFDDPEDTDG
ncbi:MAG: CPA1 family monovalent cation:H+ antiporter [Candidatus Poriferisodalaceae bacterium]|jgi:CPA1 family monovalent cation:H+ antiporter